jgi:hypothetical protein
VEVTGAATASCSKTQLWNILSNVMYLQSLLGRLPSDKYPVNTLYCSWFVCKYFTHSIIW